MIAITLATPAITGLWNIFRAARHVIKAGLGPADVRLGVEREFRARREEAEAVAVAGPTLEAQIARRRRYWRLSGHVSALAFAVTTVAAPFAGVMTRPLRLFEVAFGAFAALSYLASYSVEREMRKRADLGPPRFGSRLIDGLGDRLMGSRFIPWLFSVARLGLDVRAQNEPPRVSGRSC